MSKSRFTSSTLTNVPPAVLAHQAKSVAFGGFLLMCLAALCWGVLGVFATIGIRAGLDGIDLAFWRALVGGLFFGAHALKDYRENTRPRLTLADAPGLVGFGVCGIGMMYAAFFTTLQLAGAATAILLMYTGPGWVVGLEWLIHGRRPSLVSLAAVACVTLGVACVAGWARAPLSVLALAAGLASGLGYASHYVWAPRYVRRFGTATTFAYALPVGAITLTPFVHSSPDSPWAGIAVLGAALVSTYLASLFFGSAITRIPPVSAAAIGALEPIIATVAATVLLHETLTTIQVVGAALVISGMLLGGRQYALESAQRVR